MCVMIVIWRVLLVVPLVKPGLLMSSSILVISIISVRKRGSVLFMYDLKSSAELS